MKHKNLANIAVSAAIICILAPFSFPLGAIPFSLATFAIYIISCLSTCKISLSATIIYILLGAAGLPVFSGFVGGFQQIAGITGGYIIGYIPCAFIISLFVNRFENKKLIFPISMLTGTAVCYLFGTAWYSFQTKANFIAAFAICVLPFLVGDIIKIAVASVLGFTLRKKLSKFII